MTNFFFLKDLMRQNFIQIQNEDDPPSSHYFVYKGKEYPIKFDYFKISSRYFSENQQEIEKSEFIQLIDEDALNFELSEKNIQLFIDYVHRQKIPIDNDSVLTLNYLSKKYGVNSLTKSTENYIRSYYKEISLNVILFFQNDSNFETETYETVISENLENYVSDDQLLSVNLSILYRIFGKYAQINDMKIKESKIIDFLFVLLDNFGSLASPFFEFVDFGNIKTKYLNLLFTKYSKKFDFHFINSSSLKSFYQIQNTTIQTIENMKKEFDEIKSEQETQFSDKIKLIEDEMNLLKVEQENQFNIRMKSMNDEMIKFKNEMNKFRNKQIEEYKNEINEYKNEINELKEALNQKFNADKTIKITNELKEKNNELESSLNYERKINKWFFNQLDGEKQKSFYHESNLVNDEKYDKIRDILTYLSNQMKKSNKAEFQSNYIFIPFDSQNNDVSIIGINSNDVIETLYENKAINSFEFSRHIKNFSEFIIELKYPTSNYSDIYKSFAKLKKSFVNILNIGIYITELNDDDFADNKNISYVKFGSSITEIPRNTFRCCSSLKKVIIPSSITSIGEYSFSECPSLNQIIIKSNPQIKQSCFEGCLSTAKIEIPSILLKMDSFINFDDYNFESIHKEINICKATVKRTGKKFLLKSFPSNYFINLFQFLYGIKYSNIELTSIIHVHEYRFPLSENESKSKFYEKINNFDFSNYLMITDFVNGNVETHTLKYLKSKGSGSLNPTIRSKIIFGVAATMKKLHEKKIIFCSLNNTNVYLDENFEPKIDIFSCYQLMNDDLETKISLNSPYFIAPELCLDDYDSINPPIDVYSFAVFVYRMFSLEFKLSDNSKFHNVHQWMNKIQNGARPEKLSNIPENYWNLIEKCWCKNPCDRLSFIDITEMLKDDEFALEEFGMKTDLDQLHEYQKKIDY